MSVAFSVMVVCMRGGVVRLCHIPRAVREPSELVICSLDRPRLRRLSIQFAMDFLPITNCPLSHQAQAGFSRCGTVVTRLGWRVNPRVLSCPQARY